MGLGREALGSCCLTWGSPVNTAMLCFGPWEMRSACGHRELVPTPLPRPALAVSLASGCAGIQGK